jgi:ABC-2 type transport system ATP-binding protein
MEEAERFFDRIGIIDNGEIVAQGTLDELRTLSKMKGSIEVAFHNFTAEQEALLKNSFNNGSAVTDNKLVYPCDDIKSDLPKVIIRCSELGLEPSNIAIQEVNLENIFLKFTGKQLRD